MLHDFTARSSSTSKQVQQPTLIRLLVRAHFDQQYDINAVTTW
jgi:hypothetical protein